MNKILEPLRGPLRKDKSISVLLILSAIKFLIHVLTSGQFGYFRDEFYYIAASKHLDFGYVDFPPLIALVTRLVRGTLGESLLALHLLPALAGAVLVFLTGWMARQLGASPFGQGLAALATLVAPQFLGVNTILSMDSFDILFWGFALYLLILIFKDENPRTWLWFGLAVGVGLTNKVTLLYFSLAMVIGLALTGQRKAFRSPWLYEGGAIAVAFLVPYLIWNAMHGWPTLEFWGAYGNKVVQASPVEFFLQQILIMHPFTFPLWAMGLLYFFSKRGARYRPFGWMYLVLLAIFMLQHAKNYFLAPIYPVLFAAGAVFFEQSVEMNQRRAWLKPAYVVLLIIGGIVIAPLAVPVLPLQATVSYVRGHVGDKCQDRDARYGRLTSTLCRPLRMGRNGCRSRRGLSFPTGGRSSQRLPLYRQLWRSRRAGILWSALWAATRHQWTQQLLHLGARRLQRRDRDPDRRRRSQGPTAGLFGRAGSEPDALYILHAL